MRIAVFATLVVAAGLVGCNTPRSVGLGQYGQIDGYRDGMTVVTPTYIVTSPPSQNLSVRYGSDNLFGRYSRGRSYNQVGSTDPGWWIR